MRKFASIRIKLQALTGLMALALVAVFATSAERAYDRRVEAQHIHAVVSVSRALFMAMQTIRFERSTANSGLEAAGPIDQGTQHDIAALRASSNAALDKALAEIGAMGIPVSDAGLAKIADARQEFDRIRASTDAAMLLPKNQRPPTISGLWVAAGGKLVDSIDAFSERLSAEINQADPLIAEMMKIKQLAWVVRDAAGVDRLTIGSIIASGENITPAQKLQFATLGGRIDAGWQVISEDARWLDLPRPYQGCVAKAQKVYFQDLRARRKALLDDIAAGKQSPITGVEWVNLSNPGLEAIMNVANTAFDQSDAPAAVQESEATQQLVGALFLRLFFLGFGVIAVSFVLRRIALPMADITTAMRAVAAGDLDRETPFVNRQDEIGELARTLDIFRDKGRENRRLADELLQQERLSALGQLTATVAHELRNPLSAIRNTVYTFKELAASRASISTGRSSASSVASRAAIASLANCSTSRASASCIREAPLSTNGSTKFSATRIAAGHNAGAQPVCSRLRDRLRQRPRAAGRHQPDRQRGASNERGRQGCRQRPHRRDHSSTPQCFELVIADNGPASRPKTLPKSSSRSSAPRASAPASACRW